MAWTVFMMGFLLGILLVVLCPQIPTSLFGVSGNEN